jgi:peroxiredoxin
MVEEGKPAPDFELGTDDGDRVRLSDFRGSPVVLFFYPGDDSRGNKNSMARWGLDARRSRHAVRAGSRCAAHRDAL